MEKAAGDEKILLRLIDEDDIPDDGLGFHAQQAVEKRIKAVLAQNEVVYERTHNIAYLVKLLDDAGITKPDEADDLPNLSPWAAELRYGRPPGATPDRPTSKQSTARSVHRTAIRIYAVPNPAPIAQLDGATPSEATWTSGGFRLRKATCAAFRDPADSARLRMIHPRLGSESTPLPKRPSPTVRPERIAKVGRRSVARPPE
jgi:HEPN domain-containing protein